MKLDGQIRTDLTDKQWSDIGISGSASIDALSGRYLRNARTTGTHMRRRNKIIHWVSTDLGFAVPLNFLSSYEFY